MKKNIVSLTLVCSMAFLSFSCNEKSIILKAADVSAKSGSDTVSVDIKDKVLELLAGGPKTDMPKEEVIVKGEERKFEKVEMAAMKVGRPMALIFSNCVEEKDGSTLHTVSFSKESKTMSHSIYAYTDSACEEDVVEGYDFVWKISKISEQNPTNGDTYNLDLKLKDLYDYDGYEIFEEDYSKFWLAKDKFHSQFRSFGEADYQVIELVFDKEGVVAIKIPFEASASGDSVSSRKTDGLVVLNIPTVEEVSVYDQMIDGLSGQSFSRCSTNEDESSEQLKISFYDEMKMNIETYHHTNTSDCSSIDEFLVAMPGAKSLMVEEIVRLSEDQIGEVESRLLGIENLFSFVLIDEEENSMKMIFNINEDFSEINKVEDPDEEVVYSFVLDRRIGKEMAAAAEKRMSIEM